MKYKIGDGDKEQIKQRKIREEIIEDVIENPDWKGQGMNSTDKGFIKEYGHKTIVVEINGKTNVSITSIYENITTDFDNIKSTQEVHLMGTGQKKESFYESEDDVKAFGHVEKD
jgi:accessory colonization factor AcfC